MAEKHEVTVKSELIEKVTLDQFPRLEFYDRSNNQLLAVVEQGETPFAFKVHVSNRIEVVVLEGELRRVLTNEIQ